MSVASEIVTLPLDEPELDPAVAYAKLRSFAPERPSFLLESLEHDTPEGRYSIVGYRVRRGGMTPPGVDAIASLLGELEQQEPAATFAEGVARGSVGYFTHGNAHTIHGIRPWDEESASSCFLRGATVVVFDHQERRVTVAGPKAGRLTERCVWELAHSPVSAPSSPPAGGRLPEGLWATLAEEQLAARVARAKRYLGADVHALGLAQQLTAPGGSAVALDAYLALRAASQARAMYFIDFAATPFSPPWQLFGATTHALVAERQEPGPAGGPSMLQAKLRACFPHAATTGAKPLDAARVVRRLEETGRELLGAMVGHLSPGRGGCFALAERPITARGGSFELHLAIAVGPDTDPAAVWSASHEQARAELAAIGAAQQALAHRDDATP